MKFCGPGGIRTRVFFSAIDEQVGENGKKAVYYVYYVPKSPYCASISVPKLFPNCSRSMKQGKAISSSVLRIKVKKLKNFFASISIHSRFVSARMLNQLIMSRATQCPARINGYGITDAS